MFLIDNRRRKIKNSSVPLLDLQHLSIDFADKPAVRDLSLSIAPGESLGLVGESGSGKSATALAIMRLLPPQASMRGRILYQGDDLLAASDATMRSIRGRQIAMIFQEPMTALNPVMRVGDQVAEAVVAHGGRKNDAQARAVDALRDVGIPDPEQRA